MGTIALFFTTLFSVLASNIALVITILLIAFILYMLITSKPFRLIIKALKDAIVKKLAEIPFIAKAIYASKIRGLKKDLELTREMQEEVLGTLHSKLEALENNEREYKELVKKATYLKKIGNKTDGIRIAKEAVKLKEASKKLEECIIPSLQASSEAAEKKINAIRDAIETVERVRDDTISDMEISNLIQSVNDVLIGDQTSEEDQLLEAFQKKVTSKKHKAIGSEIVYANTPEQKMRRLENSISESEAQDFFDSL